MSLLIALLKSSTIFKASENPIGASKMSRQANRLRGDLMPSDWRKDRKQLYFPPTDKAVVVDVPELKFFMVDGEGNPNNAAAFPQAIEALFSMSYTLKFDIKKKDHKEDFKVGPLEALWWNNSAGGLEMGKKEDWQWTAMILQPDSTTEAVTKAIKEQVAKKKEVVALGKVRLESFREGKVAQIMHIGPYQNEGPNIQKLRDLIAEIGGRPSGKHHEIYMSDPGRTPPEKWKTIIRQPFI
jgi:hypothetical protein